jgi:hypothetical protein
VNRFFSFLALFFHKQTLGSLCEMSHALSVLTMILQVAPDLAGDSQTRFMTYWTVRFETSTLVLYGLEPSFRSQTSAILEARHILQSIAISMDFLPFFFLKCSYQFSYGLLFVQSNKLRSCGAG